MKLKTVLICFAFALAFSACAAPKQNSAQPQGKKEVYSMPDGSVLKVKLADNELNLVVANSPKAKADGLSYKKEIPEDGMIFFFYEPDTLSFWMKDMNFPIDIVWIAGNKVVGIEKNAPAPEPGTKLMDLPIYRSNEKADTVVELEAGASEKLNIVPGSLIEFQIQ